MAGSRKQAAAKGKRSQTSITASTTHRECLQQALQWFVGSLSLTNVKLHGNVNWNPAQLVGLAVLWVWSDKSTLTGAFKHALVQEAAYASLLKPARQQHHGRPAVGSRPIRCHPACADDAAVGQRCEVPHLLDLPAVIALLDPTA